MSAPGVSVIPIPPASSSPSRWTVYAGGRIIGWVRRAEDCACAYARPAGTYWAIPRAGPGGRRSYPSPAEAGAGLLELGGPARRPSPEFSKGER